MELNSSTNMERIWKHLPMKLRVSMEKISMFFSNEEEHVQAKITSLIDLTQV